MHIGLIIIGDEILSGKRADKHFPKVVELLQARNLSLSWARYAGDDRHRITADLRDAFAAARDGAVIFSCGGIGATPDDHTRQCAAAALDRQLVLHPQARELIIERMREVAAEQGKPFEAERPDNLHRLNMGVFPEGAEIIPNPYNRIPGFAIRFAAAAPDQPLGGGVFFLPGFPVMAWPMIEWVLDHHYAAAAGGPRSIEKSVIVFGAMEAALTPLMEAIELQYAGIKVFSLPSVDHPQWGRHIEMGVKGTAQPLLEQAFGALLQGLRLHGAELGPELVR
ncbi:competence/damage-inducible protein A [Piscinibacter sakaiensis]|uniref:competence/damage-inducible protein A n=1 Tax=Piscinibacter sakaiensis TaxID=1547922 RepID=UPI003AAB64F1